MSPSITFLGAADTVTGSRYLVETTQGRILVDCGLFQGFKKLRQRNWHDMPIDPQSIDAVILTHAHIDHSGYLPRLCKLGFRGRVHCTPATEDLLQILLPDSAHLQEADARRANRHGYSRHAPALPLYTAVEADRALERVGARRLGVEFSPIKGMSARFSRAGHILGSACVRLEFDGLSLTFTGDVGRPHDPVLRPPVPLQATDYLVTESTYGDRRHASEEPAADLARIIRETAAAGGTLLIPAFAVGRAQQLLHLITELESREEIPQLPLYLDSPMAIRVTGLLARHREEHTLDDDACRRLESRTIFTASPDESKAIDADDAPKIVISASGMLTGGRVLHHLRAFADNPANTILLVGFQAGGTRGRALADGSDAIKVHGEYVPVRARIAQIDGLSAHADYAELLEWLGAAPLNPRRVFVTHGEANASDAFRKRLSERFGWAAEVPEHGSRHGLGV